MTDTDATTQFLLEAVRDAIEHCVMRSHGDPKSYDYQRDPDGYVAFFISALHRWSNIHGLKWEAELHEAEDIFEEHMWQTGGKSMLPLRRPFDELTFVLGGHAKDVRNNKTNFSHIPSIRISPL